MSSGLLRFSIIVILVFSSIVITTPLCNASFDDAENIFSVDRVIDGNTIRLASRRKVHLLGVNAPELHDISKMSEESSRHHVPIKSVRVNGESAYKFIDEMIGKGKVRLAYDWVKRDKQGSILAYVYLENGTLLNAAILSEGLAYFDDSYPFQHQDDFKALEKEAREQGLGVWGRE